MSGEPVESMSANAAGGTEARRQVVTSRGVSAFHHAFGGINAIHTDANIAKPDSQISGVVQHGIRTLFPLVSALLERCDATSALRIDAKFLAAVKVGETVTSSLQQASKDGETELFELWATNADGVNVLAGKAEIKK